MFLKETTQIKECFPYTNDQATKRHFQKTTKNGKKSNLKCIHGRDGK